MFQKRDFEAAYIREKNFTMNIYLKIDFRNYA